MFWFGHRHVLFPLGISVGVHMLALVMALLFYSLRNAQAVFQGSHSILDSYQQCMIIQMSPHPHHYLPVVFIIVIFYFYYNDPSRCEVSGFYYYLMDNDVRHLSCMYWPFVYHFWRNVYVNLLAIFKDF